MSTVSTRRRLALRALFALVASFPAVDALAALGPSVVGTTPERVSISAGKEAIEFPATGPIVVSGRTDVTLAVRAGTYVRPPLGADKKDGVVLVEKARGVVIDL